MCIRDSGARVSATYAATSRIFPALARHYGVAESTLALRDLYVVRYDASSPGLATHVDASALSFSVALNGGYGGGGLEFALLDETLAEDAGDAVLFPSRLLHRAAPVVSGARYALVGLVDVAGARGVAVPGLDNAAAAVHGEFAAAVDGADQGAAAGQVRGPRGPGPAGEGENARPRPPAPRRPPAREIGVPGTAGPPRGGPRRARAGLGRAGRRRAGRRRAARGEAPRVRRAAREPPRRPPRGVRAAGGQRARAAAGRARRRGPAPPGDGAARDAVRT